MIFFVFYLMIIRIGATLTINNVVMSNLVSQLTYGGGVLVNSGAKFNGKEMNVIYTISNHP